MTYLCDHHMAVESSFVSRPGRFLDMGSDLGDDGGTEGHVGDEVTIHDVNMEPVGTLFDSGGTGIS